MAVVVFVWGVVSAGRKLGGYSRLSSSNGRTMLVYVWWDGVEVCRFVRGVVSAVRYVGVDSSL